MNIEHISVSRKGVWDLCQEQYKFKYHLKVIPDGEEPFYFVYGKIVHKIAEEYVEAGGKKLIQECATDVITGKVEIEKSKNPNEPGRKAPPIPMEYKRRLPEHMSAIKKITDQIGFDGKREYEFKYDLDPPHNRLVTGFIDRLIIRGDNYFIVDYKTTKKGNFRKTPQNIKYDLQLRTYARVVQREFGAKPENIKAALYYLEGGNLIATGFTDKSLLSAEAELLEAYRQIEALPPEKAYGNVGFHCNRCDYRKRCKFYSLTGEGT